MSVYKHSYRAYTGRVTPARTRVLVLARYGLAEVWSSKITVALFILCLIPCLVFLFGIYLANNPIARALIGSPRAFAIDATYFLRVIQTQCWAALAVTAWIAPRLISFDLADNALPILLSHPISRFGYVLGKFLAIFSTLSLVTLVPCLTLFIYEGYSSPEPWFSHNLPLSMGMVVGILIWIVFLSLLGLALSSWVKWRVVATGTIFASVFVPAGVGAIVSEVLRTHWGLLLNIPVMMSILWERLLGTPEFMRSAQMIPTTAIVLMLSLVCCLCFVMLNARIRGREVVRG
jgi:ABC-type transport system involved in multi-copper enzyme maturation permease subunit